MLNVEANSGNCNCLSIILVLEEAHNGRLARVVQSDNENAHLLVTSIFGENLEETSTEHHFSRYNVCLFESVDLLQISSKLEEIELKTYSGVFILFF